MLSFCFVWIQINISHIIIEYVDQIKIIIYLLFIIFNKILNYI